MQSQVVLRIKTRLAQNFLYLPPAARCDGDARAECRAIRPGANQLQLQPMIAILDVVPQQRRRLVHVPDDHVDIAIVVEISEPPATPRMTRPDPSAPPYTT